LLIMFLFQGANIILLPNTANKIPLFFFFETALS
jgi:hypothetical protein